MPRIVWSRPPAFVLEANFLTCAHVDRFSRQRVLHLLRKLVVGNAGEEARPLLAHRQRCTSAGEMPRSNARRRISSASSAEASTPV